MSFLCSACVLQGALYNDFTSTCDEPDDCCAEDFVEESVTANRDDSVQRGPHFRLDLTDILVRVIGPFGRHNVALDVGQLEQRFHLESGDKQVHFSASCLVPVNGVGLPLPSKRVDKH